MPASPLRRGTRSGRLDTVTPENASFARPVKAPNITILAIAQQSRMLGRRRPSISRSALGPRTPPRSTSPAV
eukprot:6208954-Pyramimonas_sp.AAC.1